MKNLNMLNKDMQENIFLPVCQNPDVLRENVDEFDFRVNKILVK
jgi:hypothetical protein